MHFSKGLITLPPSGLSIFSAFILRAGLSCVSIFSYFSTQLQPCTIFGKLDVNKKITGQISGDFARLLMIDLFNFHF